MAVQNLDVAIAKFAKRIDLSIGLVVERLTLDLFNRITERTPVDTGRARQSWQVGVGSINTTVPASRGKSTGANRGASSPPENPVATFPGDITIDGTEVVYITSSLPYIESLENGNSTQAPAGMVRLSIAEVEAEIEAILAGVGETE